MRKTAKIWLVIAASLVFVGLIMFAAVMSEYKWDFSKLSTGKYETNTYEISEEFSNLSMNTDTADIKAFTKELSAIGRNINQIAKRINAGGPAYQADMDEIRERLDEIWQ